MFDLELFRTNKKYLIIGIIITIVFLIINIFISNDVFSALSSDSIKINKLVINEVMTSNKGALVDENGNLCDWIELYNGYSFDVNLKNYSLSDTDTGKIKWTFPDTTIKSGEYMIIYVSDEYNGKNHATFSLSQSGNEMITLKRPNGNVLDAVRTMQLPNNYTMARDSKGKWFVTAEITPGFDNNKEGRNNYLFREENNELSYPLQLSEFLPANEGNVIFDDNKLYEYIEVTNIGNETINLHDYYLSNSEQYIYKWRFPSYRLASGDSYLVITDCLNKDNHASFDLKNKSGYVILSTYDGIVENVLYEDLTNGVGYIKENNKWNQGNNLSPGYNNVTETDKYQKEMDKNKNDLIINELMSSNNMYLAQNGNQFYDWIELYNNTDNSIKLSDYSLTTDYDNKKMYVLPNVELPARSYYILMASGNTALSNDLVKHTNFKLSTGTGLFLYKNDSLVDSSYIYSIPKGFSYGRGVEYGHYYFSIPSPLVANSNGLMRVSYNPIPDVSGGVFNNVNNVVVNFDNTYDTYYTLDGSTPTNYSYHYDKPLYLDKTTVVKAVSYIDGQRVGDVVTNSYIINENHALPVVSLSLDSSSFNTIQTYINDNYLVAANAELYDIGKSFNIDCNMKLYGGESRGWAKKSFALKFDYGNLHYKVFDDKNIHEFNSLVLRSGSQDQNTAMIRDEFATSIAYKYGGIDAQATKPVVLYINGSFWGVYYLREKINDNFIENNYNVPSGTNITNCNYFVEHGSNSDITGVRNFIASHDMSNDNNYNHISNYLDIDNYIDFWVFQFIVNNTDIHNYRYYNNPLVSGGKIRMILYDLDYSMYVNAGGDYINYIQYPNDGQAFVDTTILSSLMKNYNFRKKFASRIGYFIKNVWNDSNINKEFDYLYNSISYDMARNCDRWGLNYSTWQSNALNVKNYALNRKYTIINATKSYFNLTQEEVNEYFY